ncbi:hypothetical protein IE81DRAFT_323715 [Ceraceosorus guamensis]|uniref:Uncharacterized protein n=1 Tax=Ceraceosorus guamensis TaxID=1522189 RepID=A0A316W101_9BASI|nr:hypothetical protein IE81DRAFT_323715 [Ceraceosorus guamensis]PWN42231.1 hypothetical protein IE81DRAFT_323715 [Ceraceosorus guamensis]
MVDSTAEPVSSSAHASTSPRRPFSLASAFESVRNSIHSQFPSSASAAHSQGAEDATQAGTSGLPAPQLSSTSTSTPPSDWPPLISERKLARLFPDHSTRDAVRQFYKERQLDWDCDAQSLGERNESNRAAAALFDLLVRLDVQGASDAEHELPARLVSGFEGGSSNSAQKSTTERSKSTVDRSRAWEAHDVLQAIDKKDVETLMRIRDASFDLLLDAGGATKSASISSMPLGYAISLGPAWEGIAIVLVGAMSRFVNQLPDEQAQHRRADIRAGKHALRKGTLQTDTITQARLRKLRVNLKLAIDHSISLSQVPLVTSYVQVLFMSEGSTFLHDGSLAVQRALLPHTHDSALSPPALNVARGAVERFVAPHLRSRAGANSGKSSSSASSAVASIAALEDLIANASLDLVLLALWDLVLLRQSEWDVLSGTTAPAGANTSNASPNTSNALSLNAEELQDLSDPLPLFFFARDDRMTLAYLQRSKLLEKALASLDLSRNASSKRERRALRIARNVVLALQDGARRLSAKEREEKVARVLQAEGC